VVGNRSSAAVRLGSTALQPHRQRARRSPPRRSPLSVRGGGTGVGAGGAAPFYVTGARSLRLGDTQAPASAPATNRITELFEVVSADVVTRMAHSNQADQLRRTALLNGTWWCFAMRVLHVCLYVWGDTVPLTLSSH